MIDVMKRLEELDKKSPNISNPLAAGTKVKMPVQESNPPQLPDLTDLTELKALSGLTPVSECGMMGMSPMGDSHPPVATFSINATAADGDEVASMLTQIMNLAGMHKVGPQHMPGVDGGATALTSTPAMAATPMDTPISKIAAHGNSGEVMRAMLDKMNDNPEDEGYMSEPIVLKPGVPGDTNTEPPTEPPTEPADDGYMSEPIVLKPGVPGDTNTEPSTDPNPGLPTTPPTTTDMINNPPEDESMGMGQEGDLGSMADEIRGMADELSDMEPEDIGADGETDEGSIQGGVWTADAPKPGQPNVPPPSGDPEGVKDTKPKTTPPPKKTSDSGEVDQPMADAYRHPMRKMMDMIDNESYDNTPADPNNIPANDSNKMAWNPNAGGANKGVMNQPSAMAETLEDKLFNEYKKFVSEGKDEFGPGKNFAKIAKSAGGGEKGNRIAGKIRSDKIKKAGGKVKYAK